MKITSVLLSLCFTLLVIQLAAQPIMTENAIPQIGQVIPAVYYEGDLELGADGADRVWDFPANPTSETIFTNYRIIAPADAPHQDLFPEAEMVLWLDELDVYNYIRVVDNQLQNLGFAQGDGSFGLIYTKVTDGEAIGVWPLTFGDTFTTESMFETYLFGNKTNMGVRKRTASVDAYGTVTTPYGTFEDVLKVSIKFDPSPNEVDQVIFLAPSSFMPLVTYDIANFDGLNPGYFFLDLTQLSTHTKNIETEDFKAIVAQNSIILKDKEKRFYDAVEVFDMEGKPIAVSTTQNHTQTTITPKTELPTGMYIIRIAMDGRAVSLKIFIP